MALQKSLQNLALPKRIAANLRYSSTSQAQKLVAIDLNPVNSIATVTLQRPPANAMSTQQMQQVKEAIKELEARKCRGLILTSASERIYSAGLDLKALYKSTTGDLTDIWLSLQNMWLALFSTPLPTVALINGHALAGGCVLAICCDYRIMLPNFFIGLNETEVGIPVPGWVIDTYANVMPSRRVAEADLIAGKVYRSEEALRVGLIDELAAGKEQALSRSVAFLEALGRGSRAAQAQTKLQFRANILSEFHKNRQLDLELFLQGIQRQEVQAYLGDYLKTLKGKSAKR